MNCSVCTFRYTKNNKPYSLPCGHTFCERCIGQNGNELECFKCHKNGKTALNVSLHEVVMQDRHPQIDKFVKVCFFGESGVGKTSLIGRLAGQDFTGLTTTTVGIDFRYKDQETKGKVIRYQLWDSAGQEQFRSITPHHYRNSHIIILVYSLTFRAQQNDIPYWLQEVTKYTETKNIIVVGNKHDISEAESSRLSISEDSKEGIAKRGWKHMQISCKDSHNIDRLWSEIHQIGALVDVRKKSQETKSIVLQKPLPKYKKQDLKPPSKNPYQSVGRKVAVRDKIEQKKQASQTNQISEKCPCIIM